jgi:hypothetical protein
MGAVGHVSPNVADYVTAQRVFRPDIYRTALTKFGVPLPGSSSKLEGSIIDPSRPYAAASSNCAAHRMMVHAFPDVAVSAIAIFPPPIILPPNFYKKGRPSLVPQQAVWRFSAIPSRVEVDLGTAPRYVKRNFPVFTRRKICSSPLPPIARAEGHCRVYLPRASWPSGLSSLPSILRRIVSKAGPTSDFALSSMI